jgi:hypothetical protein
MKLIGRGLLAAAAASVIAVPSGATAAMKLGETFPPPDEDCKALTFFQTESTGSSYRVPADGVITSWSFHAGADAPVQMKFKVARAAPGTDLSTDATLTVVAESGPVDPPANALSTYPVRIGVAAGDIIGLFAGTEVTTDCIRGPVQGFSMHYTAGDVSPGSAVPFQRSQGSQLSLSALLEPDCDGDGFGDETQDADLSSCRCKGQAATLRGTEGDDVLQGTPGRDVIAGLGGRDEISGLDGSDLICGGAGADSLRGDAGEDELIGEGGKDILRGGEGKDNLRGGEGKDNLRGGKGKDNLRGGKGKDRLRGGKGRDRCNGGKQSDRGKSCEVEKSV